MTILKAFRTLFISIFALLCFSCSNTNYAYAQEGAMYNDTLTATGNFPALPVAGMKVINAGITSYTLFYAVLGAPASVSIQMQGSTDGGVTFATSCGAAGTATSGVNIITCAGNFTHFRINLATLTGGTNPSIIISLFGAAPSLGGAAIQGTIASNGAGTPNPVVIGYEDVAGGNFVKVFQSASGGDAVGTGGTPLIGNSQIYNGTNMDRARSASLVNYPSSSTTTARNSIGAEIYENGSRWIVSSQPAAGSQATASIAAEASVRHVLDSFCFASGSVVAPALTSLQVNIRDGASGAGTLLASIEVEISGATGENTPPLCIRGLNIVGTTNTALTVEWSAALASLKQSVFATGFNIN